MQTLYFSANEKHMKRKAYASIDRGERYGALIDLDQKAAEIVAGWIFTQIKENGYNLQKNYFRMYSTGWMAILERAKFPNEVERAIYPKRWRATK